MQPRKNATLLSPSKALLTARIKPRFAPRPKHRATVEGWLSWSLIDRAGKVVGGGEQHNLILDNFLDYLPTATDHQPRLQFSHFAVGTGSTEPAVTDVALDAELARFTQQVSYDDGTDDGTGVFTQMIERELDFGSGNGNLTEWGLSTGASDPIYVRELFRDSGGNAVTVTKTSDYKLRLKYTRTWTLTPALTPAAASFTITGIGAINGQYHWLSQGALRTLLAAITGNWGQGSVTTNDGDAKIFAHSLDSFTYASSLSGNSVIGTSAVPTPSSYTPGSHTRTVDALFGTAAANDTEIAAFAAYPRSGTTSSARAGFAVVIDEADRFTKDNLHTLLLTDFLTVTWGRGT